MWAWFHILCKPHSKFSLCFHSIHPSTIADVTMPPDFEKREYWNRRFASETSFEWLVSPEIMMKTIEPYLEKLAPDAPILHLGFGTSDLQVHLRKAGFTDITNVD